MSAFVVTDATINRIVTTLHNSRDLAWLQRPLAELGFDPSPDGARALGRAMLDLNIAGVDALYGDGDAESFRALTYQHRFVEGSLVAAYKALSSFIYQCSEGDVPERPLYIFLDHTARIAIADAIISALPAYDQAKWG